MGLIKKPSELQVQTTIKALLYGQPGIGKTTDALSAPYPVLLDFDNGVHRVNVAHQTPTLQVSSYNDFLEVMQSGELAPFKTIVIDTAGKMLDYMGAWLIQNDPKLGQRDGSLSLTGYGARKAEFIRVLKSISIMGKHIVFVAHEREEKEGDQKIIRPEIGGSSAGDLIKELDLVGYVQAIGKQRTISFDPCEKFYGKNTCNLPSVINIPRLIDENGTVIAPNDLLTNIFKSYQENLEKRKEEVRKYNDLIALIDRNVEAITDCDSLNDATSRLRDFETIWDSKIQASRKLVAKAAALSCRFNKETGKYEPAA